MINIIDPLVQPVNLLLLILYPRLLVQKTGCIGYFIAKARDQSDRIT